MEAPSMKNPKIRVFVNQGRVEAIYTDTCLLDIEVIECRESAYLKRFDKHYEKAEREGLEEAYYNCTTVCTPWYDEEDEL